MPRDIPRLYVACYDFMIFYVYVQCVFLVVDDFDDLCWGDGRIFFLKSFLALLGLNGGRICLDCGGFMFVFGRVITS